MTVELRTDHGPQYTGADGEALCRRWKLNHTFAPVGHATGNAVVERFIRTLKEELIWLRDWDSADELRAAITTWLHHYLHHRPHQALNWQTPIERRAERPRRARRARCVIRNPRWGPDIFDMRRAHRQALARLVTDPAVFTNDALDVDALAKLARPWLG